MVGRTPVDAVFGLPGTVLSSGNDGCEERSITVPGGALPQTEKLSICNREAHKPRHVEVSVRTL